MLVLVALSVFSVPALTTIVRLRPDRSTLILFKPIAIPPTPLVGWLLTPVALEFKLTPTSIVIKPLIPIPMLSVLITAPKKPPVLKDSSKRRSVPC